MAGILSRRRWLVLSFLSASVGFVYLLSSPFKSSLTHDSSYRTPPEDNAAVSPDSLRVQAGVGQVLDQSSPTLSVLSQILVISRPSRLDRRATMEQLRAALGLDWDYVDAISSDDQAVNQIADCLRLSRKHAHLRTFEWPSRFEVDQTVLSPLPISPNTSVSWSAPTSDTLCRYPVPPASNASVQTADLGDFSRSQNTPPMETSRNHHSRATSSVPLTCAVQDRTHGVKYTPSLLSYMLLTPAKFACWYSHLEAIQRVAAFNEPLVDPEGGGTAALILEDDVDIERDIRERLREAWSVLPDDWDIVFLGEWLVVSSLRVSLYDTMPGHCWSDEARYPALRPKGKSKSSGSFPKMSVHPSFAPKCTHAYALSRAGARRILLHLLYPPFAYSRALDQAFAWLVQSGRVRAFSIVPSLVIQHKLTGSDIDGGENGLGSGWKDQLEHGFYH